MKNTRIEIFAQQTTSTHTLTMIKKKWDTKPTHYKIGILTILFTRENSLNNTTKSHLSIFSAFYFRLETNFPNCNNNTLPSIIEYCCCCYQQFLILDFHLKMLYSFHSIFTICLWSWIFSQTLPKSFELLFVCVCFQFPFDLS